MIGYLTYFRLVNLCYRLPRKKRIPLTVPGEIVSTDEYPKRIVRQVEEYFATAGFGFGLFDRYKPAEFLVENTGKCLKKLPDLPEAYDRFEKLFIDINTCQASLKELKTTGYTQVRPIVITEPGKKTAQFTEAEKV